MNGNIVELLHILCVRFVRKMNEKSVALANKPKKTFFFGEIARNREDKSNKDRAKNGCLKQSNAVRTQYA